MRAWRAIVSALAHREPATPLGLTRILVGAVALGMLLKLYASGTAAAIWLPASSGGLQHVALEHWLWGVLGPPSPETLWPVFWSCVAGSLALVVGLGGRLGALVLLQGLMALLSLQPISNGGFDLLLNNALWLLVLAPCDATLSVWCRIRTGRWVSDTPRLAWVRYVVVYQLMLMYCATGVQKVGSDWWPWGGFHAVYYVLFQSPWLRWPDPTWVAWLSPVMSLATMGTIMLEMTWFMVPLALYYRATRTRPGRIRALSNRLGLRSVYALGGVALHGGIWLMLDVGTFSTAALALYPCLFHHDELASWWRRAQRRSTAGDRRRGGT